MLEVEYILGEEWRGCWVQELTTPTHAFALRFTSTGARTHRNSACGCVWWKVEAHIGGRYVCSKKSHSLVCFSFSAWTAKKDAEGNPFAMELLGQRLSALDATSSWLKILLFQFHGGLPGVWPRAFLDAPAVTSQIKRIWTRGLFTKLCAPSLTTALFEPIAACASYVGVGSTF